MSKVKRMDTFKSPGWWFGVIVSFGMIAILIIAQAWDDMAGSFPILVASVVLLCGLIHTVAPLIFGAHRPETVDGDLSAIEPGKLLMLRLRYGLWIGGLFVLSYLVGFEIAVPVYLILFMRAHGESWLVSASAALGMWAFLVLILSGLLHISLPFPLLGSFLRPLLS